MFCLIQDCASSHSKGIGKEAKGLYYLLDMSHSEIQHYVAKYLEDTAISLPRIKLKETKQGFNTTAYVISANNQSLGGSHSNATLWHYRLGHVPFSRLSYIPGINVQTSSNDTSICVTCPLAKHTHLPFSLNEHSCQIPFGLIHIDIWGPYKECTHNQNRYFLTIVDDCTRATWTYLLKFKSQAFATLEMFCNYAQNQFNSSVKIVRSDNALEFDTTECQLYFAKHGIVHQTSCVDTPQQNGRVERKHRHLLEMSRALRFQAHLPLRFWGDCVLTATYIINRLPTRVLHNSTPYEKLLHKPPTISAYESVWVSCLCLKSIQSKG